MMFAWAFVIAFTCTVATTTYPGSSRAFADEFATFGKRVVTVAYFEDGDYMSTDEEGRYVGYNIEYLNEIARYADWTYEYVKYPSWEEACAALEASKVDLLPMVYYTEDRERRMIFSASSLCEISTTLNVRLDDTRYAYEDFKTFSGMRVGVIANSQDAEAFAQYSEKNGFSADIVAYSVTGDLLKALDEGAVDAIAITYLGTNSRFRTVAQFAPRAFVHRPLARTHRHSR